ncbi:hypothetical protein KI387_002089, partial [Taxus chinensis]
KMQFPLLLMLLFQDGGIVFSIFTGILVYGGSCDDYWAHALCFPCALVQEWREIAAREDA